MLTGLFLLALATVALDVPPDTDEAAVASAVASCESVLGDGQCVRARSGSAAKWVALVEWDEHRLTITLRALDAKEGTFVARTHLDFSPQDGEDERWVASGLMVAALAAAQPKSIEIAPEEGAEPAVPEPVELPPPAPAEPVPSPAPEPPRMVPLLDVGGLVGAGLDDGGPRWGGQARVLLEWGRPRLGVAAGVRGAARPAEPSLLWSDGALGLVASPTAPDSRFGLDLTAEGVVQGARATATEGGQKAVASSYRGGGRAGATVWVRLSPAVGWWLSGDVTLLRPALEIRIHSETVGREGPIRWAAGSGLRCNLARE